MIQMLGACLLAAALLPITDSWVTDSWAADQTITLRLGAGSALTLARPFKTVLISDPDIVDVRTQSERAVILAPLDIGAANLVFLDQDSIAIANVRVEVRATGANRAADGDGSAVIVMVRDARSQVCASGVDCLRAPHHEGFRPHPEG